MERDVIFCGCGRIHTNKDIQMNHTEVLSTEAVNIFKTELAKLLNLPPRFVVVDDIYRFRCSCGQTYLVAVMYGQTYYIAMPAVTHSVAVA